MRTGIFSSASVAPVLTETTIFDAVAYPGHLSEIGLTGVLGRKILGVCRSGKRR